MKKNVFLLFLISGLFSQILPAQHRSLKNSVVTFQFVSKGVEGTIAGFSSTSKIDLERLEDSSFSGSVQSETLDTNNGLRNWSLRSGKYFDVDDFPLIQFQSTTIVRNGSEIVVTGDLTIKATTKTVKIVFTQKDKTLVGNFSLYSSDYGIKIKKKREDNLVRVKLKFDLMP